MSLLFTVLLLLVSLPTLALAGQFGLKSPSPDRPFAGAYLVKLDQLPACSTCFAYWDLRFQFDEDGLDPDFPGEKRWAVAVQVGRHRGDAPDTMRVKLWDNVTGTAVTQVVAMTDPDSAVTVDFEQWDDPVSFTVWWQLPPVDGSVSWDHQTYTFPPVPGTRFKRAVVQARLSSRLPFAGWVRLYEEGNNFRRWLPITQQAGCTRLPEMPPNELHVTCTAAQRRARR